MRRVTQCALNCGFDLSTGSLLGMQYHIKMESFSPWRPQLQSQKNSSNPLDAEWQRRRPSVYGAENDRQVL